MSAIIKTTLMSKMVPGITSEKCCILAQLPVIYYVCTKGYIEWSFRCIVPASLLETNRQPSLVPRQSVNAIIIPQLVYEWMKKHCKHLPISTDASFRAQSKN